MKDGIVALRGEATREAQKDLTTEYAEDVEGVKDVKNEMTVAKTLVKPAKTVGEKVDDASITAQVKAKNAAEKDLATKFANDVRGVKKVNNHMTIE